MKRARTELIDIVFRDDLAEGWVFDVPGGFKPQLDILYTMRLDREKTATKQKQLGRKLENKEKIYKLVWTRGAPPAYSFTEGQVFYDPPGTRRLAWADALQALNRRVQIMKASPDPGAVGGAEIISETAPPKMRISIPGVQGKVEFEVAYYQNGMLMSRERREVSQSRFAAFLKTGCISEAM